MNDDHDVTGIWFAMLVAALLPITVQWTAVLAHLIELLVVIAIIAILAAMLLPAWARRSRLRWYFRCFKTLKQLSARTQYADDNSGKPCRSGITITSWAKAG